MMRAALLRRVLGWAGAALVLASGATHASDAVPPSPESVQPLAVGARVPAVTVEPVTGEPVDLAALVRERGALLVFYRGGW